MLALASLLEPTLGSPVSKPPLVLPSGLVSTSVSLAAGLTCARLVSVPLAVASTVAKTMMSFALAPGARAAALPERVQVMSWPLEVQDQFEPKALL